MEGTSVGRAEGPWFVGVCMKTSFWSLENSNPLFVCSNGMPSSMSRPTEGGASIDCSDPREYPGCRLNPLLIVNICKQEARLSYYIHYTPFNMRYLENFT